MLVLLVLDSLGIGGATDAHRFGGATFTDEGANTLAHIAENHPLHIPNLTNLGLAHACEANSGTFPAGPEKDPPFTGAYAFAREISSGKDTPSGHWEIAGVPVPFDWSYFPDVPDCFPKDILRELAARSGVTGSLGNCHASGTEIIARLGATHIETGKPIYYTSADSVFQIAAHEESFGLDKLYALCKVARQIFDASPLKIGRVIARPFIGDSPESFTRTGNRHDYAVPPPSPTVLQNLTESGGSVIGIGKIADIYAHTGITHEIRATGHPDLWKSTLAAIDQARLDGTSDNTLVMTNFVDFDALYGHRRDVLGYAKAIEEFDLMLPALFEKLDPNKDLLILTADHGNDPTWQGTDHTRENVPVLLFGKNAQPGQNHGDRKTFADIAQTVASHFRLPPMPHGTPIL